MVFSCYNIDMDFEKAKKRQTIRLILTEIFMVFSAVVMVGILVFVVSGYWINENFEVSRSGMLQISSMPNGATVTIDGESLSQRTNVNRVISTGEHTVTITKDGYDSWTKKVNIKEGLLYRLQYPRLFPEEHELEDIDLDFETTSISVSPKRDQVLLINNSTKWALFNIDDEKNAKKELNLANVLRADSVVQSIEWSDNQNRVLVHTGESDWLLIDLNSPEKSINLSTEFGVNFSNVVIANNSADTLLVQRDNSLQKISLNDRAISAILVENVDSFYNRGDEVIFVAKDKENQSYAGLLKLNKAEVTKLFEVKNATAKVFVSNFYDAKYITVIDGTKVAVFAYDNVDAAELSFELSFAPEQAKLGRGGEFVTMNSGTNMATLDMELETVKEWTIEKPDFGWLDNSLIYVVENGELVVYDFDGLNRRVVASGVKNDFPAVIAGTKWLYYMSENKPVRELLVKK